MERRPEQQPAQHPAREELEREHGRSDRESRPPEKPFPPRDTPSRSGEQAQRKFGERRKERGR